VDREESPACALAQRASHGPLRRRQPGECLESTRPGGAWNHAGRAGGRCLASGPHRSGRAP